jgi:hypothetical protein
MELEEIKNLSRGQTLWVIGHYKASGEPSEIRVNGQVKTWKTRPNEVQVPYKHGLKECGYITESNMGLVTLTKPENIPKKEVKETNAKFKGL